MGYCVVISLCVIVECKTHFKISILNPWQSRDNSRSRVKVVKEQIINWCWHFPWQHSGSHPPCMSLVSRFQGLDIIPTSRKSAVEILCVWKVLVCVFNIWLMIIFNFSYWKQSSQFTEQSSPTVVETKNRILQFLLILTWAVFVLTKVRKYDETPDQVTHLVSKVAKIHVRVHSQVFSNHR